MNDDRNTNHIFLMLFSIFLVLFATFLVTVREAEAQTFGSAPGCAYTYEPPGGPWTDYTTDEAYRYVDLHRADGTVDRIQPAPAGTLLPGTAVRIVKCYPSTNPEVPTPTPTPTPEVPVPTPTPEANDEAPNVTIEVLRCNDTDRPNTEAYATADGPGWVDGNGNPLPVGERVLVAWNSYATLIHAETGEFISIEALGSDTCVSPNDTSVVTPTPDICHEDEPCWDCETMGNRICGPNYDGVDEPPVFPLPEGDGVSPDDDNTPVPPYGDTSSVPPTAADPGTGVTQGDGTPATGPVPGEDVLAYTDSDVTYLLLTLGLTFLAAGVGLLVGPPIGRRIGEWLGRR
jgi:hypothetical protein